MATVAPQRGVDDDVGGLVVSEPSLAASPPLSFSSLRAYYLGLSLSLLA